MQKSAIEIEKLIKKGDQEEVFGNVIYNLMTNLNQPYSDIVGYEEEIIYSFWKFKIKKIISRKGMPLPLILELLKILDKQNKDMEKEMKKRR